jgi:hypothetical protein
MICVHHGAAVLNAYYTAPKKNQLGPNEGRFVLLISVIYFSAAIITFCFYLLYLQFI